MFSGSETTCNSIFRRFGLILVEIFAYLTTVLTHEFTFFLCNTFRAKFWHFGQMKLAKEAYVKLFSGSETTCNSIFRRFGSILVKIFAYLIIVLTHEFTFFQSEISALLPNETGKRSLSKIVQRVRNYLQLDF